MNFCFLCTSKIRSLNSGIPQHRPGGGRKGNWHSGRTNVAERVLPIQASNGVDSLGPVRHWLRMGRRVRDVAGWISKQWLMRALDFNFIIYELLFFMHPGGGEGNWRCRALEENG